MKRIFTLVSIIAVALSGSVTAREPVDSLGALKKLEAKVKQVVKAQTNATVSLISPRVGSSGSGVIVSADGLILTAAHVTEGSKMMTVIFPDGRQEQAKVLGANYTRDASMAKLVGEGPWPFAEVADSDPLEVGTYVVAMGHPKGFDPTRRPPVRFGRIMSKGEMGFITTDCTLIAGDSGGPLFDLKGQVVGIHSHIAPDRQVNNHAGISGFKRSWDKMLTGEEWGTLGGNRRDPNRPVLGVMFRATDDGLLVGEVSEGSPALTAGLRSGDIVTKVAGMPMKSLSDVSESFADLQPGDEIKLTFLRDDEELTKSIKLARLVDVYPLNRR